VLITVSIQTFIKLYSNVQDQLSIQSYTCSIINAFLKVNLSQYFCLK